MAKKRLIDIVGETRRQVEEELKSEKAKRKAKVVEDIKETLPDRIKYAVRYRETELVIMCTYPDGYEMNCKEAVEAIHAGHDYHKILEDTAVQIADYLREQGLTIRFKFVAGNDSWTDPESDRIVLIAEIPSEPEDDE